MQNKGDEPFIIKKGMKIAEMVLVKYLTPILIEKEFLYENMEWK